MSEDKHLPELFNPDGWSGWMPVERNRYKGRIEVTVWAIAEGMYGTWVGTMYLDSYDDVNEAKQAGVAYVESLYEQ